MSQATFPTRAVTPLRIELEFARAQDLLSDLMVNGRLDGLRVVGKAPGPVGADCSVTIRVREPAPCHFTVRAILAWARHKGSAALRESYGIDFHPEDVAGRNRLLQFARAEIPNSRGRYEERIPARLPVKVVHQQHTARESLADISQGGAFVRALHPLPPGEDVMLVLPGRHALSKLKLRGKVVWSRATGDPTGMGIEFIFDKPEEPALVRELMDRLIGPER